MSVIRRWRQQATDLRPDTMSLETVRDRISNRRIAELEAEVERLSVTTQGAVDTLAEVRLYAEKMLRSGDGNTRIHGADLLGIIDHDAGGQWPMTGFRDDPAFLRDEAIRQAALAALVDRARLVAEVERLRSENEWLHRQLAGRQ
jgi:hypothetical protein